MSEKMTKEAKQKLMIGGAIFKMPQSCKSFVFDDREFVGSGGSVPSEHEWDAMELQFLSQKAQQVGAKEYGIIPPDIMALLMVAGEVLEFKSLTESYFSEEHKQFRVRVYNGDERGPLTLWDGLCRVKQAPKMERRYQWLYKNLKGAYEATFQYYATDKDAMNALKGTNPSCVIKIVESAKQFKVGE